MKDPRILVTEDSCSAEKLVRNVVEGGKQEDPFFVMNLGEVAARHRRWQQLLPRVEPFYAVKCNTDKTLLKTLAALGTGFDCASRAEIELVTSLGVAPERIIFAHTIKLPSHMRYAASIGVNLTTFDSEDELMKIKRHMPDVELLLRIRCDAEVAQCPLGIKFGCEPAQAPRLLQTAATMGLDVAGLAFHVGSNAGETGAFKRGVRMCAALFARATALGLRPRLLDIGGGFPGDSHSDIQEFATVINAALDAYFTDYRVRVIAEPGRYFAAAACTLAACVYAKRTLAGSGEQEPHTMYYLNDGVFGSFKDCVLYNFLNHPTLLYPSAESPQPCTVWGPTCDSIDCVLPSSELPPLAVGSWLLFHDMGAYTMSLASRFNGFPLAKCYAYVDRSLWSVLKERKPFNDSDFICGELGLQIVDRTT